MEEKKRSVNTLVVEWFSYVILRSLGFDIAEVEDVIGKCFADPPCEFRECPADTNSPQWTAYIEKLAPAEVDIMEEILAKVLSLQRQYSGMWHDKRGLYWLTQLLGEVGELGKTLVGEHRIYSNPDYKLMRIAAICLNWLDMRAKIAEHEQQPVTTIFGEPIRLKPHKPKEK